MGLLDNLLGAVAGQALGNRDTQQALVKAAMQLIGGSQGGLGGLTDMLTRAGLGNEVKSWVSTGANLPVDGEKLGQALGGGVVGELARSLGTDRTAAAGGLAAVLPQLIDQLTPDGAVPQPAALEQGLAALAGKLLR
jgi:uncharacterized protein YidB (DUF937 family)